MIDQKKLNYWKKRLAEKNVAILIHQEALEWLIETIVDLQEQLCFKNRRRE